MPLQSAAPYNERFDLCAHSWTVKRTAAAAAAATVIDESMHCVHDRDAHKAERTQHVV